MYIWAKGMGGKLTGASRYAAASRARGRPVRWCIYTFCQIAMLLVVPIFARVARPAQRCCGGREGFLRRLSGRSRPRATTGLAAAPRRPAR
jgi:hypothetical protein